MTTTHRLVDDEQLAVGVLDKVLTVMQSCKCGLVAGYPEPPGPIHITAVFPESPNGVPAMRNMVTGWRESAKMVSHIDGYTEYRFLPYDGVAEVMAECKCSLIPVPIKDEGERIVLCEAQADGKWRAFAVVARMDCYGYEWRPVKPRKVQ